MTTTTKEPAAAKVDVKALENDPELEPFLKVMNQSNGKLANYFLSSSERCMEAIDNLMSYGETFGQEMSSLTVKSHLLIFYYCMSEPLVHRKLSTEIHKCLQNQNYANEVTPCSKQIMKAKRIADRAINYAAQLEDEQQRKRGEGSLFDQLRTAQTKCLSYLMKQKYCTKFLEQSENDLLPVTPEMWDKCHDLERKGLECIQSVFCQKEQQAFLECMERGEISDCMRQQQQLTMCGETNQAMARVTSIKDRE